MLFTLLDLSMGRTAYVLTDENFEHDTQMIGGATTGDWLVLFCERKLKKRVCDELYETWNELSGELYGRLTAATVDT